MEQSDIRLSDPAVAGLANAIQIEVLTTLEKLVPTMRKPAALAASRLAGELAAYVATLSPYYGKIALQAQSGFVIKQLQQSIALYSKLENRQVKDAGRLRAKQAISTLTSQVGGLAKCQAQHNLRGSTDCAINAPSLAKAEPGNRLSYWGTKLCFSRCSVYHKMGDLSGALRKFCVPSEIAEQPGSGE